MTSSTTPQDRAVELIANFIAREVNADSAVMGFVHLQAAELAQELFDEDLLSSGTQEDQGDGSLRSKPSAVGASVSFDALVDWVTRLEVTVKPVNGVVTIAAESMAEAFGDFLHANGIEVTHVQNSRPR